jgi:hypothetical protein
MQTLRELCQLLAAIAQLPTVYLRILAKRATDFINKKFEAIWWF